MKTKHRSVLLILLVLFSVPVLARCTDMEEPDPMIQFYESHCLDGHIDVNHVGVVQFRARWANGTEITSSLDTVVVGVYQGGFWDTNWANTTLVDQYHLSWNNDTGYWETRMVQDCICKGVFSISRAECDGVTIFTQDCDNVEIIWDRIIVVNSIIMPYTSVQSSSHPDGRLVGSVLLFFAVLMVLANWQMWRTRT